VTGERWEKLDRLFAEALVLEPEARAAMLTRACGADESLRIEALSLLTAADASGGFLATPALERLARTMAADGWTLQAGERLGVYTVRERVGSGGAGEVWRATDERLDRDVAIKVLLPHLSDNPDRLRDFVSEARTAGALNHANILSVYDVGEHRSAPFIVCEYLEGESLRARLQAGPLPVETAVRIAVQVARGLAAAHARDIVHRDLKPENVFLRSDGGVKLLDFGLAKLQAPTLPPDASVTVGAVIAGTAGYMAPEQATGAEVDSRADLFALGATLYEMLTGERAFTRASTIETLHAVVTTDLPTMPASLGVPPALAAIVTRLVAKSRNARFQSAADAAEALERVAAAVPDAVASAGISRRRWRWVTAAIVVAAAGFVGWRMARSDRAPTPPVTIVPLTTLYGLERGGALSPDGQFVAFTWTGENQNWDIYVKPVSSPDVRRLTTSPERDITPRWSPDGREIAYTRVERDGTIEHLRVMSALGGSDRAVSSLPILTASTWSADGRYVLAGAAPQPGSAIASGIYAFPLSGGEPRRLTAPRFPAIDWMPDVSPDGRRLAYASCQDPALRSSCDIHVVELDNALVPHGAPRRLTPVPFWSVRGVTWSGDGRSIIYGVAQPAFVALWRVDADGAGAPVRIPTGGFNALFPRMAPNIDRLVFTQSVIDTDIYRFETARVPDPVARSSVFDGNPRFSPDGRRIAFCSTRSVGATEVWMANRDGSAAQQVTRGPGQWQCSPSWAPDGRRLAFESLGVDGQWSIWIMDVDGRVARQITTDPGDHRTPSWSHDGQWLYFSSAQADSRDIWRMHLGTLARERVTRAGSGLSAVELPHGRAILYQPQTTAHAQDAADAPVFAQPFDGGEPRQVVDCVRGTAFTAVRDAIYYIPCQGGSDVAVYRLNPATGERRQVGRLPGYRASMPSGFEVSPDERTILYDRLVSAGEDLMLIENFR
jgi:Tol biopolymer transport system component